MNIRIFSYLVLLITPIFAKLQEFYFNVEYTIANPDGVFPKKVISFNGTWPLPTIEINKGDQVKLHLINGLPDASTSLHFHGLKMKGLNHMDGPVGVTQCPINPGLSFTYDFTVQQSGTFWYHSHSGSQYSDGLRGLFVVHDVEKESNYKFDHQLSWSISDWYHLQSKELIQHQLTRYNPTGGEPIPQNILFNDSRNVTIPIEYDTTYLIRIANIGLMVSQFFSIPGYEFEIIEVDGTYTKPVKTKMAYLTVGQRISILLKTKSKQDDVNSNILILTSLESSILDSVPDDLELNSLNYLIYDDALPLPELPEWANDQNSFSDRLVDEMNLVPFVPKPLLPEPDHRIELTLHMDILGDGINYAFFNNFTYVAPKTPTLLTAIGAPKDLVKDSRIYGSNTNSFILNSDDIIEIVINNEDNNKHPMHMHGHVFQVLKRSESFEDPVHYDPNDDTETFPEFPLVRDTVHVEGNGYLVLRFKADNPGVWFFHCHLDFHLEQGLAITLIEAPDLIDVTLPEDQINNCIAAGMPVKANAAGNSKDFLNLDGETLQPKPLPLGFTWEGYVALFVCTLTAFYGLWTIYVFGMRDVLISEHDKIVNERKVTSKYIEILGNLRDNNVGNEILYNEYDSLLKQVVVINSKLSHL